MTIEILIAPSTAPQVYEPCLPPARPRTRLYESLTDRIVEVVIRNGLRPTPRWGVVETLAPNDDSAPRSELRRIRAEILQEIDRLVRTGKMARVGRWHLRLPGATAFPAA